MVFRFHIKMLLLLNVSNCFVFNIKAQVVSSNTEKNIASSFDFPVGIENKGVYVSKINNKTYKGWYVASEFLSSNSFGVHPGEDWNGLGMGNTDAFQPVYAIANGVVTAIDTLPFSLGKAIMIEHYVEEQNKKDTLYSVYVHVDNIKIKIGERVTQHQPIAEIFSGTKKMPAHVHLEIRKSSMKNLPLLYYPSFVGKDLSWIKANYISPKSFIIAHKKQ